MFNDIDCTYKKNPCYKCDKRAVGCHGTCQEYLTWSKENTEFNKRVRDLKAKGKL